MKFIITTAMLMLSIYSVFAQTERLTDTTLLKPLEVISVRAGNTTPVAKTNYTREMIYKLNTGQDLPFIINQTPSLVVNSDAGNGIGYTGIRIRGSDASRINITLNNIPYNDAESQGTFLVNLPDFASSANSIQVQRGVGTSTNGAGAFGGSVNISTNEIETNKSISINNSVGSFRSIKNTIIYHSGLFNKHFLFDGRISNINSNGYIDRASSRLQSLYGSAAYVKDRSSLRINVFTGKEKTYQAWYGINEQTLKTNRRFNSAGMEKTDAPYDNETDNYTQTHYQVFFNQKLNNYWKANITGFFTKGKGYYEQYKADAAFADYGLPDYTDNNTTKTNSDIVRQLWLNNNFYGNIYAVNYHRSKTDIYIGGGWNVYEGKHYGKVKYTADPVIIPSDLRWYDLHAKKTDYSGYVKWSQSVHKKWETLIDLQLRAVQYNIYGFRYNPELNVMNKYTFFNPKAGITYTHKNVQFFMSYARAAKEPNRDDFEAGINAQPTAEKLDDYEAGFSYHQKKMKWQLNVFYMNYTDQLVLTGKINDVGAYTRSNVKSSYRAGIELENNWVINKIFSIMGNIAVSENKVKNFEEYIDDYDNGGQIKNIFKKTDLSYSPPLIANVALTVKPISKLNMSFNTKYVDRQFMDNTSNKARSLGSFVVQDVSMSYIFKKKGNELIEAGFKFSNLFSEKYEPNGYTFSYQYNQQLTTENYYFPMAPINWMLSLNMKF